MGKLIREHLGVQREREMVWNEAEVISWIKRNRSVDNQLVEVKI